MNNLPNQISILPAQAHRISQEAGKTGATIGVSPSSSYLHALIIDTGRGIYIINAGGGDIPSSFE
jgi:hypothetical protein